MKARFRNLALLLISFPVLPSETPSIVRENSDFFLVSESGKKKKIEIPEHHSAILHRKRGTLEFNKFSEGLAGKDSHPRTV